MGFEKYQTARRRRGSRCQVCGQEVAGRVAITLQARTPHPDKKTGARNRMMFPAIDSTSASFCEKHAVEVYETAKKAMLP